MRTADAIAAYIESRRARRASPKYLAWLRYTLGKLGLEELPADPETIEGLQADLGAGKLADKTVHDIWKAWRLMYGWLAKRRDVVNVMADVEAPIVRRRLMTTFTSVQVEQLLFANRRYGRDYALVRFLLDTGARIGEAATLRRREIVQDDDGWMVRVDGKEGQREVPISRETAGAVLGLATGEEVWGGVLVDTLQKAATRALRRANLPAGPHALRHTFGRLYIMAGGDVFSLQRIMGHRSIETTKQYVDLDVRDIRVQHAKFSPMAAADEAGQQLSFLSGPRSL